MNYDEKRADYALFLDRITLTPKEFCSAFDACYDGAKFALQFKTMAEVWDNCTRVGWLCWILERLEVAPDEKAIRLFMCWAARNTPLHDGRTTWDLLTEEASRNAVNVALRFARDEANAGELSAAYSAAESAAGSAAYSAAGSAAWSAARSAAWSAARSAAESAAHSAAWSAAESAAQSAAWSAARSAARSAAAESAAESAQSSQFKLVFKNPFKK